VRLRRGWADEVFTAACCPLDVFDLNPELELDLCARAAFGFVVAVEAALCARVSHASKAISRNHDMVRARVTKSLRSLL
jgi:hypothetical protein